MTEYEKRKLKIYEEQLKINKEILEVQREMLMCNLEHLKINREMLENRPKYVPVYVEKQPTVQPTWTYYDAKGDVSNE